MSGTEVKSESALPAGFGPYMAGQGLWFLGTGIQFVLFQTIGALLLDLEARLLGFAQMTIMLPSLLFMLFGGAMAERRDGRRFLSALQVVAMAPPLVLAGAIFSESLSYGLYLGYGLAMGTLAAFIMPTRDGLLPRISGGNIQRAVTLALGLQFAGMLAGMGGAALSGLLGVETLLLGQAAAFLAASLMAGRLPPLPPAAAQAGRSVLHDVADGLKEALQRREILSVMVMMIAVGVFYIGAFLVVLPLLVRDYYGGGGGQIGLLNIAFWSGSILVSMLLLRVGRIEWRGGVLTCGLFSGLVILVLISFPAPFWVLSVLCFFWGCGAGISMSMSRTIVQELAPPSHQARVMSIYQLSFMGGAPFGALMIGLLAQEMDLHRVVLYPAAGMLAVLAVVLSTTPLLRIRSSAGVGA